MPAKVLKWLILLALLLLVVSFVSFRFRDPSFRDKDVILEIEGPTQAVVGDEVVYKLKYSNDTKLTLKDMKFTFFYPAESVVIKDGFVREELTEKFTIDSLDSKESGTKEFKAFIVGDRGDIKDAKVNLAFKAGTLRSEFEKQAKLTTTVVSVPISLTLVAPPNAISGQALTYILDYRNESQDTVANLLLEFDYPDGFFPREYSSNPDEGNNRWRISSLKKGSGGRITIQGKLDGREGETKSIAVTLKRKINDQYVNFERATSLSMIASSLLDLGILVNDSSSYVANPGDTLNYSILYKNSSTITLNDMNLSVKFDGDMYDLLTLNAGGGFFDSSLKIIVWNSSNTYGLTSLSPNNQGKINFNVKLKSDSSLQGSNTLFVKATARLSTPNVPENVDGREVSAISSLVTHITSQPTLTQLVYYNDPNFGSNGPLPPQATQETVFTVRWQVTNPGNDLNNTKVSAILPDGVIWKNVFSSNFNLHDPIYDKNTSEVSWILDALPNGLGGLAPRHELAFQIGVNPIPADKDRVLTLIRDIKLVGVDSVTKQNIVVRAPNATTGDLADRPGEGIVQ